MKTKAYPRYKASGVEWLGEVPEHWEVLSLRRIVKSVKTGGTPAGVEDSAFNDDGYNWYSPSDFSESVILGRANRKLSEDGIKEVKIFPPKTIMVVGIGATIGKVGISIDESSCNQQINGIVCEEKLDPLFGTYYLKTKQDFIVKCGKFTTLPIINQEETKNLIFTVPPLPEQQAIASFLGRETGRIDSLIGKKQRIVELLKEKRTALISQAVTKGLNPKAKMKPSGVEWLGEVPEHWEVKKLKFVSDYFKGFAFSALDFSDTGVAIIKASNLKNFKIENITSFIDIENQKKEFEKVRLKLGDAILSTVGSKPDVTNSAVGQIAIVSKDYTESYLNQNTVCIRPRNQLENTFLKYVFMSDYFRSNLGSISNWIANQAYLEVNDVTSIKMLLPNIAEQQTIATYLDHQTAKLDTLISKVEQAILKLKEYRTALISAAVTGKIDVRGAA
jgi:type I restriction enzyme S subunit